MLFFPYYPTDASTATQKLTLESAYGNIMLVKENLLQLINFPLGSGLCLSMSKSSFPVQKEARISDVSGKVYVFMNTHTHTPHTHLYKWTVNRNLRLKE